MEEMPMCNIIAYVIALISSFVNPSNMEVVAAPKTVTVEPTSVVCFTEVTHDTLLNEVIEVATEPITEETKVIEVFTTEAPVEQISEAPEEEVIEREEVFNDKTSPEEIEVDVVDGKDSEGHDLSEENMVTDEEPIMDEEPIIPDEPVVDYQIEEVSDYEVEEVSDYEVEEVNDYEVEEVIDCEVVEE